MVLPRNGGMLPSGARVPLPSRLSEADLDIYAENSRAADFAGRSTIIATLIAIGS